jgi:hypothetical protein
MVKGIFGHAIDVVDNFRDWVYALQHGGVIEGPNSSTHGEEDGYGGINDNLFLSPYKVRGQQLLDVIIGAIFNYTAELNEFGKTHWFAC